MSGFAKVGCHSSVGLNVQFEICTNFAVLIVCFSRCWRRMLIVRCGNLGRL